MIKEAKYNFAAGHSRYTVQLCNEGEGESYMLARTPKLGGA